MNYHVKYRGEIIASFRYEYDRNLYLAAAKRTAISPDNFKAYDGN